MFTLFQTTLIIPSSSDSPNMPLKPLYGSVTYSWGVAVSTCTFVFPHEVHVYMGLDFIVTHKHHLGIQ